MITKIRAFAYLSVVTSLFLAFGSALFYPYLQNRLEEEAKQIITKSSSDFGVQAAFDELRLSFTEPLEITDVKVNKPGTTIPFVTIKKITFDYDVSVLPGWHVTIKAVHLEEPVVNLFLEGQEETDKIVSIASQGETLISRALTELLSFKKKIAGDHISVLSDFDVSWHRASLYLNDQKTFGKEKPIIAYTRYLSGKGQFDFSQNTIQLWINQEDLNYQSAFVEIKPQKNGFSLLFEGKNLLLNPYAKYFPDFIIFYPETVFDISFSLNTFKYDQDNVIDLDLKAKGLGFDHWRVASHPIRNININLKGRVAANFKEKRISFDQIKIGQGKAIINVDGFMDFSNKVKTELSFALGQNKIQDLLNVFPKDFIPVVYDAKVAGLIDFQIKFALDMAKPSKLVFEPTVNISDYKLLKASEQANIFKLKDSFTHHVKAKNGKQYEIEVNPKNWRYVSYYNLGQNVIKGVLTCEDGRFFRHKGFQLKHIRDSIAQNIKEKRFARGGSTITMQLAKNLFLSGEKTLSRKFQEMLIAYAMEQEIDKKRLLEIYMNIIEWGPGIYGVRKAASHYFGKKPSTLSALEAAYLGSVIANPNKYYYMYRRGSVTETWANYLSLIVRKMHVKNDVGEPKVFDSYKPEFSWVKKKKQADKKELAKK